MNKIKKYITGKKNECLNLNCWLVKNLHYPPYKRCQHCRFRFRDCLFLHYQIVSAILIFFFLSFCFLSEGRVSARPVIAIFIVVIVYGYFFNRSTETIVEANFEQAKAKDALEDLSKNLAKKVHEQTADLKRKNINLQKLLKMREEFLDIASHQLKTPISVIRGTISMFKDGSMDKLPKAEQKKFLDNIYHKTEKLNLIIADILRASEIDSEDFKIDPKTAQKARVENILKSVQDDLKELAQDKGVKLTFNLPAKPTPMILTSIDFLEQAFYNLVDNAIKYSNKGEVKVDLAAGAGEVIIKVSDNGIGIPEADKKKMFEKFSRARNAVNMYTDGSGLGLFIVKRIIEAHPGGSIGFDSHEGKGTVFTVKLKTIK